MPARVFFRRRDDTVISEADLRQRLADALGLPHNDNLRESNESFILGETGIAISLALDESGNPVEARAEIPMTTDPRHVSPLFNAFRAMGWES